MDNCKEQALLAILARELHSLDYIDAMAFIDLRACYGKFDFYDSRVSCVVIAMRK